MRLLCQPEVSYEHAVVLASEILGPDMVGQSKPMQTLVARRARVAPTELPVLIQGETGTGKELVAQAIHKSSHRPSGPWIAENCGAFAEGLLVSELFGHVAGAFTRASDNKRGLFELAHGGTLFLDEVGEMSPKVQVNLLRVLQDGMIRRLGAESATWVDVRVVAATHRDLSVMVKEGSFREDLYYRLRGATLDVPPLRARQADLELLIQHFLKAMKRDLRISTDAWPLIRSYGWPGNVRELRAEVMRWHGFCDDIVVPADLSPEIRGYQAEPTPASDPDGPATLAEAVAAAERAVIRRALGTAQQYFKGGKNLGHRPKYAQTKDDEVSAGAGGLTRRGRPVL